MGARDFMLDAPNIPQGHVGGFSMKRTALMRFTWLLLITVIFPYPAQAYLDPGTGSMILQLIIGALAAGLMVLKIYWMKFKSLFSRFTAGGDDKSGET